MKAVVNSLSKKGVFREVNYFIIEINPIIILRRALVVLTFIVKWGVAIKVRRNLVEDRSFRRYFEGESTELPAFYKRIIEKGLGVWWPWLSKGAIEHDANAYLHKSQKPKAVLASP